MKRFLAGVLLVVGFARACFADGDIVFSARFYNPPSKAEQKSYWHLYRINPDGSGKRQITSGAFDDIDPQWSPDGRLVAFARAAAAGVPGRDEIGTLKPKDLCLINTATGDIRTLRHYEAGLWQGLEPGISWSPGGNEIAVTAAQKDGKVSIDILSVRSSSLIRRFDNAHRFVWSPEGGRGIVVSDDGSEKIADIPTGKLLPVQTGLTGFTWTSGSTVAGASAKPPAIVRLEIDKADPLRTNLKDPPENLKDAGYATVSLFPPDPAHVMLYATISGESTGGHYYAYYRVDLATGKVSDFMDGRFLVWSPNRRQFCTIVNRSLADYGKRPDGTASSVWTQPLLVGDGKTGKTREIVNGLVYVVGADWKPSPKHPSRP